MGRDITWPAGNYDEVSLYTDVKLTHQCYEGYRGYESAERQLGNRFVVDADGKAKKGFNSWTLLEEEAYAPTDYEKYKTVFLRPGDFIITSLRSENEKRAKLKLLIYKVGKSPDNPRLGEGFDEICPKLEFELDSFWSDIPDSEWTSQIPEILHKAVRKAFKIPKRVLKVKN